MCPWRLWDRHWKWAWLLTLGRARMPPKQRLCGCLHPLLPPRHPVGTPLGRRGSQRRTAFLGQARGRKRLYCPPLLLLLLLLLLALLRGFPWG